MADRSQLKNKLSEILVSALGKYAEVIGLDANALSPIDATESGIITEDNRF